MAEGSLADRIFGLPIYTSPYFPGDLIVMANRPYKDLSGPDLTKLMAEQLAAGRSGRVDATVFGETAKTYLSGKNGSVYVGGSSTPISTKNEWSLNRKAPEKAPETETMFRMGPDGPEAVTRLKKTSEVDDLTWLRRRVNEICWSPR